MHPRRIHAVARAIWLEMLRRKDLYVLLILLGALLAALLSLNIFGLGSTTRYIKDVGLLMVWLLSWIVAVTVSARQLPGEETRGTIFALLAKPVSRAELVTGKWLGSWVLVTLAAAVFHGLVVGVVLLYRGTLCWEATLQAVVLHAALLSILAALGVLCSTRMNFDAAASLTFVLSGAMFAVVPRIPGLLVNERGPRELALLVLYYLLPHFELFDMRRRVVHDWGPAPWGTWAMALLYGAAVTAALLVLAWLAYRGKRFSRKAVG